MFRRPSKEVDRIRQELVRSFIAGRETVDGQLDGLTKLVTSLREILATMIGGMGARATLVRAASLAEQKHPCLSRLVIRGEGLDSSGLREVLRDETPDRAREELTALVSEWFNVLYWLLGDALMPVLLELESDLLGQGTPRGTDEEGP